MPDMDSYYGRTQAFMSALLADPRITPDILSLAVSEAVAVAVGHDVGDLARGRHAARLVGSFTRQETTRLFEGASE